jgi:hypothetical protein
MSAGGRVFYSDYEKVGLKTSCALVHWNHFGI